MLKASSNMEEGKYTRTWVELPKYQVPQIDVRLLGYRMMANCRLSKGRDWI